MYSFQFKRNYTQTTSKIPNKTLSDLEEKIISIRTMAPCFGPKRIKYFYNIDCSEGTLARIIKNHGLTRKNKKVGEKRRDMRAVNTNPRRNIHFMNISSGIGIKPHLKFA